MTKVKEVKSLSLTEAVGTVAMSGNGDIPLRAGLHVWAELTAQEGTPEVLRESQDAFAYHARGELGSPDVVLVGMRGNIPTGDDGARIRNTGVVCECVRDAADRRGWRVLTISRPTPLNTVVEVHTPYGGVSCQSVFPDTATVAAYVAAVRLWGRS